MAAAAPAPVLTGLAPASPALSIIPAPAATVPPTTAVVVITQLTTLGVASTARNAVVSATQGVAAAAAAAASASPAASHSSSGGGGVNAAAVVVPILLVLLLGAGLAFWWIRRRRQRRAEEDAYGRGQRDTISTWMAMNDHDDAASIPPAEKSVMDEKTIDMDSVYGGVGAWSREKSRPASPVRERGKSRALPPLPLQLARFEPFNVVPQGSRVSMADARDVVAVQEAGEGVELSPTVVEHRPLSLGLPRDESGDFDISAYMLKTAHPSPLPSPRLSAAFPLRPGSVANRPDSML